MPVYGLNFNSIHPIVSGQPEVSNVKNIFFPLVRALERKLSVSGLHALFRWLTWPRAFFNTAFKKPVPAPPLPDFLKIVKTRAIARRQREANYLRHFLNHFPDRLASSKWRSLCGIEGLETVKAALAAGRPVILATVHFGVYAQTRLWLRAHGLSAATLVGGQADDRSAMLRESDNLSPLREIPVCFYQDQLRELKQHLRQGRVLITTIDGPAGKKVSVPFCEGWNIEIATGTLRLAAREKAEIFPLLAIDLGRWRTRIKIGRRVPSEYLNDATAFKSAAQHIMAELLPIIRQSPDQITFDLAFCISPSGPPTQEPVANSHGSGSLTAAT